jgi:hypothetical protein
MLERLNELGDGREGRTVVGGEGGIAGILQAALDGLSAIECL